MDIFDPNVIQNRAFFISRAELTLEATEALAVPICQRHEANPIDPEFGMGLAFKVAFNALSQEQKGALFTTEELVLAEKLVSVLASYPVGKVTPPIKAPAMLTRIQSWFK